MCTKKKYVRIRGRIRTYRNGSKSADDCTRACSHLPDACLACDYPGAVSVPVAERSNRYDRVGIRTAD